MGSQLSDEDIQRLKLLELENKRQNETEIQSLRQRIEELEKQLSLAPILDKELDQLIAENENLMRKIESQEQEFRVTNETLKTEIQSLIAKNDSLEQQMKTFRGVESHPECDLGVNSDQIRAESESNAMGVGSDDDQNRMSYAVLAEKEKLELKVSELQELTDSLRKENNKLVNELELCSDELNFYRTHFPHHNSGDIVFECDVSGASPYLPSDFM